MLSLTEWLRLNDSLSGRATSLGLISVVVWLTTAHDADRRGPEANPFVGEFCLRDLEKHNDMKRLFCIYYSKFILYAVLFAKLSLV